MILEQKKDLFETNAIAIAHQVNCKGVMGAGVAKLIRNRIISEEQYVQYQELCKRRAADRLLGRNFYMKVPQGRIMTYVINLFAEDEPTGKGLDTNYNALHRCMARLERRCMEMHIMHVAIPGYLGCGLAGGDWNHVYTNIIEPVFKDSPILLEIDYLPESVELMVNEFENLPLTDDGRLKLPWHGFIQGTKATEVRAYLSKTFF